MSPKSIDLNVGSDVPKYTYNNVAEMVDAKWVFVGHYIANPELVSILCANNFPMPNSISWCDKFSLLCKILPSRSYVS